MTSEAPTAALGARRGALAKTNCQNCVFTKLDGKVRNAPFFLFWPAVFLSDGVIAWAWLKPTDPCDCLMGFSFQRKPKMKKKTTFFYHTAVMLILFCVIFQSQFFLNGIRHKHRRIGKMSSSFCRCFHRRRWPA